MIYQVYRRGSVWCIPRWIRRFDPEVFEFEYLSIFRGPYSRRVGAAMLPLDMH